MANTRVKDYFDLSVLLVREKLDPEILRQAITATFNRRGMDVGKGIPAGLSDEFSTDPSRQAIWTAFLRKNGLIAPPLKAVVTVIRAQLHDIFNQG